MLRYSIILLVILFGVGFDCFGAVRDASVHYNSNSRRNRSASVLHTQVRAAKPDDKNNYIPVQTIDEIDVPDDIIIEQDVVHTPDKEEPPFTDEELSEIVSSLNEIVAVLDSEIEILDSEIIRCKHEKKTNTILTVAGAAGTLGTGIGAIIQGKKLHDAKKEGAAEKQEKQEASE